LTRDFQHKVTKNQWTSSMLLIDFSKLSYLKTALVLLINERLLCHFESNCDQ